MKPNKQDLLEEVHRLKEEVKSWRRISEKLETEKERLKQKLRAIRALCPEPVESGYLAETPKTVPNDIRRLADEKSQMGCDLSGGLA